MRTEGMDNFSSKLQIWEGWARPLVRSGLPNSSNGSAEFAQRLYLHETLDLPASGSRSQEGVEPYTLQWFLDIEHHRLGRRGQWIPRLLEFTRHAGETLLGLGNGLGTDWLQYARHGATVVVCS